MNDLKDFDKLTKHTRRYEFLDGLVDITYGIIFLALGLLCWFFFSSLGLRWFITALVKNREITILGIVLLFSLLLLLVGGSQRIVLKIRQSTSWKKSGILKPLRWQVSWPVQLMAGLIAITIIILPFGLMLAGRIGQEDVLRFLVFAVGIGTSINFLGLGVDLAIKRYVIVGSWGILFSFIYILFQMSFSSAWLFFGISWMIVLTISGIWAFTKYKISNQELAND